MSDQQGDFIAGLVTGAVLGGIVGSVIGLVLAPRLLGQSTADETKNGSDLKRRKLPKDQASAPARRLSSPREEPLKELQAASDADQALMQARKTLEEKIDQLNQAIRDTRAQLLVNQPSSHPEQDA